MDKKIDVSTVLTNMDGKPIQIADETQDVEKGERPKVRDMTLRDAIKQALLVDKDGDRDGPAKFERWRIALKVHDADQTVLLSRKDIDLITERVGELYSTTIVGRVYNLLGQEESA
jgi:hypothetical protein